MKPNVELHIEELVLHGFPPRNHHRIGETVERELARLFAERGRVPLLSQGGEIACLSGGTFEAKPGIEAEAIGARVAQSLYRGMTK